jgi:hypothetical protein
MLSRDVFSPAFFDVGVNSTTHLIKEIKLLGLMFIHQMYVYERFNGILKSFVRNRAYPEGSMVQGYCTEEAIEWTLNYIDSTNPIGVPKSRHEVGKGIIYPRMYTLDDVLIDSVSFDVVKVDMVHKNVKKLNLKVAPDDTTLTLWDAVTRRVRWRRTSIDVDPVAISAVTTPSLLQQHTILSQSQSHTIPSLSPRLNTPSQSRLQTTPTMPQLQITPTQSQQQPHALIISETRPELPLEDPPLPSPPQTRSTPPPST